MMPDRTNPLQAFLDFLRGPNEDLFAWDDVDNAVLYRALVQHSKLGLFPRDWNQYMVEIDLVTWRQITAMTRTVNRPRRQPENLWIRLAAVSVEFSARLTTPQNILAPFNLSPDQFPLGFIADVVHNNYKTQCALGTFESKEFWAAANLKLWLSARCQDVCRAIWISSRLSVLERVQFMYAVCDRTVLPKVNTFFHLCYFSRELTSKRTEFGGVYIFPLATILQPGPGYVSGCESECVQIHIINGKLRRLNEFARSFGAWRFLDSLKHYRLDLETLFTFLKHCRYTTQVLTTSSHNSPLQLVPFSERFHDQPHNCNKCIRAYETRHFCTCRAIGSLPSIARVL
jgi:hypothetical protein